jgi:hypothetical protein
MKVLICGDRNYQDYTKVLSHIKSLLVDHKELLIIEGGAKGADTLAKEAAIECGVKYKEIKADWKRYGRAAGPKRNQQMLDENPNLVLAFHPNINESKGTKDMVNRARKAGIEVLVIL